MFSGNPRTVALGKAAATKTTTTNSQESTWDALRMSCVQPGLPPTLCMLVSIGLLSFYFEDAKWDGFYELKLNLIKVCSWNVSSIDVSIRCPNLLWKWFKTKYKHEDGNFYMNTKYQKKKELLNFEHFNNNFNVNLPIKLSLKNYINL